MRLSRFQLSHVHSIRIFRTGGQVDDLPGLLGNRLAVFILRSPGSDRNSPPRGLPGRRRINHLTGYWMVALPARFPVGYRTHTQSHGSSSGSFAQETYCRASFCGNLAGSPYGRAPKTCFAAITQGRSKLISRFTKATQGYGSQAGRFRIGSYGRGTVSGRSAITHAIGHDADAGTVRTFALSLLAQGDGPFGSCFRKTAYSRRIHPLGMALITNGDGIFTVSFSLGASPDGDSIQPRSLRAIAYGQGPFAISYGIVTQCRSSHGPVCMGSGSDGQGIVPGSTVIIIILVTVPTFRVDTEIMDAALNGRRVLSGICLSGICRPADFRHAAPDQGTGRKGYGDDAG